MIRHIVLFTAKSGKDIEPIRQGLELLTHIPHASRLEIALNRKSDPKSKVVDVVVYGEFVNDAALAAYKGHALYAEAIKRVSPLRELRFAADYDVSKAATGSREEG
ncbi:Dabb family protein [Oricola cellulosilytica]|uniref:Dabb family protein n=1 Tax=Oricola cellulosilytica TaxID=1429082 RepID=A0A4R0PAK6_9HYPH|nr:Dabb family protein [Oricola cellulosilytica]TCD13325.1 Dabb family protein [Oricola cellulosilytica]